MQDRISSQYFKWLSGLVHRERYSRLLSLLHEIDFKYSISKDQNRAADGESLRYRFALMEGYEDSIDEVLDILDFPCSVLEMMVALALRCEEDIMDDASIGDRTAQWFWEMIVSLGLGSMNDTMIDDDRVIDIIERFLDRDYEPNGKGGLFTIRRCNEDLRNVEIWRQLCWYLDSIT